MSTGIKNQQAILAKLNIEQLNPMQEEALSTISAQQEIVLLSPTGTGKTLAFLLPIIAQLDNACKDIQALIEAAVKGAIEGQQKVRRDGGSLDERHFRRVEKFDGKEGMWKEWSFQFKTQVGAASRYTRNKLDEIQKEGTDPDLDGIFVDDNADMVDKLGAELYSTLTPLVSGEALMMVRGVPHGDGWKAWSKLFNRYNPKTPARALMAMMAVMNPRKVKDVRDLSQAVEEW